MSFLKHGILAMSLLLSLKSYSETVVPVSTPLALKGAALAKVGNAFIAKTPTITRMIKPHNMDAALRSISPSQLKSMLSRGAGLVLTQNNKGEFILRMNGRLKGGGLALGTFLYGATKAVAYGVLLAGATATAAATSASTATTGIISLCAEGLGYLGFIGSGTGATATVIGMSSTASSAASIFSLSSLAAGIGATNAAIETVALWAFTIGAAAPTA